MLDAGNALFGGSRESRIVRGAIHPDTMNAMGYAAMNVAERDLRWGLETWRERRDKAQFPFLSANVVISGTTEPIGQPYALFDVGGTPVAVIGLTTSPVPVAHRRPLVSGEMIDYLDPIVTAQRLLPEISERADVVIVLAHMSAEEDEALIRQVEDIDVLIDGGGLDVVGVPRIVEGTQTVVTCAGYQGQWLGRLTLAFDEQGAVIDYDGEAIALTDVYPDDPDMLRRVNGWIDRANEIKAQSRGN